MLLGSWAGEEGAGGEPACIFKGKVEVPVKAEIVRLNCLLIYTCIHVL